MTTKLLCPKCWAENVETDTICKVCKKELKKRKTPKKEIDETMPVLPVQEFSERRNYEGRRSSEHSAPYQRPAAFAGTASIFQEIFRPSADENKPKPQLFFENQGALPRLWAFLIDALIVGILCLFWPFWVYKVSGYWIEWYGQIGVGLIIAWLYTSILTSSRYQGTLGCCVAGIIVVNGRDQRLSWFRASLRFFCFCFSLASLLGVLWIVFTKTRRGWHDMLSGSRIVKAVWMIETGEGQFIPYTSRKEQWFSMLR